MSLEETVEKHEAPKSPYNQLAQAVYGAGAATTFKVTNIISQYSQNGVDDAVTQALFIGAALYTALNLVSALREYLLDNRSYERESSDAS